MRTILTRLKNRLREYNQAKDRMFVERSNFVSRLLRRRRHSG